MKRRCTLPFLVLVLVAISPPAFSQGLHTEWNLSIGPGWDVSPRVHDLDLDRRDEILSIAGSPPVLYCIGHNGDLKWQSELGGSEGVGVALGDLDGDSILEVIAATSGSTGSMVYAFKSAGQQAWTFELEGKCTSAPLVADLDWDGRDEVLVCDEGTGLHCISGPTGDLLWTTPRRMPNMNQIAVADIERSGVVDVLWFQNKTGSIWIIDSGSGDTKKTLNGTPETSYFGWPMIGDIDSDGFLDLVVSTGQKVICMDPSNLNTRWEIEIPSRYPGAMGDVDGDGELEILIPGDGVITCLEGSGIKKYSVPIETGGWMGSIVLGDIDGDGFQEALVSDHMTQIIYGLDASTGYIELSHASDRGGLFKGSCAPAIADGDWDGIVEVYVGMAFEENSPILSLESNSGGAYHHEWPQLMHDWRGSGNYETPLRTVPEVLWVLAVLAIIRLLDRSK
jgi:hypothetical protein